MNRITNILKKETNNTDRIYLYLWQEDRLMAFGRSARHAALLCPDLEVKQGENSEKGTFLYTCLPNDRLLSLSEQYTTLVSDDCIFITLPEEICRRVEQFSE